MYLFQWFFGALFVAINNFVFPRIGATKTVILVISGQMISSVILGYKVGELFVILAQIFGVAIILFGVYLSKNFCAQNEKINSMIEKSL
ncbi:hypothetical protein GCL57_10870 [Fluviispira multicolorata]|uniref:Uncharacterized protein n=1 Tax=Fluviispira multicolorata TaxID=2654512 RepID=A0A833JDL6_9BACT|nr:hypothetical protein GCL57_10870 [Fluviispira multicolorata]